MANTNAKPYLTPEEFGAQGKPKLLGQMGYDQAHISQKWPDAAQRFGANPNWSIDGVAWQQALIKASRNGKRVQPCAPEYFFSNPAYYDALFVEVEGNGNQVTSMHDGGWGLLDRKVKPTSRLQAEAMVSNTQVGVKGIVFNPRPEGYGLNLNCVKYYEVYKNFVNGGHTAMKFDFCLHGEVARNQAQGSENGFWAGLAIDGDTEMSSNLIRFVQNKCHSVSGTGFFNEMAYETHYIQNIVEGNGTIGSAFYFDGQNKTTCKDLLINTFHFEQTGGAVTAIIHCLLRDQKVRIRMANAHYAGIVVEARSSGGGGIILEDLQYAPGQGGKLLRSNNTMWRFIGCEAINPGNAAGIWATDMGGQVAKKGWANDVGYNSYLIGTQEWLNPQ